MIQYTTEETNVIKSLDLMMEQFNELESITEEQMNLWNSCYNTMRWNIGKPNRL